ncbi:MAG TPA: 1,4-alpha-glucan branching protein GlgB [Bryobacteraceae bacterium]|nr:1,4-alpha-glucan branching protein GlgB [Bryobacteraceae bacterium]
MANRFVNDGDLYFLQEGTHMRLADALGAHLLTKDGTQGTNFAVWAPNAKSVSVFGDFNDWNRQANPLAPKGISGIWEGFVPDVSAGTRYKYFVESKVSDYKVDKSDPLGSFHESSPSTASVVWNLDYEWRDGNWMEGRRYNNSLEAPIAIYEVHLGSWQRATEEGDRFLSYREMAGRLVPYVKEMGFTHVEFLPVMEHPFYGSWGYQTTGYFAPTSRYGTPQDFMALIDELHQNGIGVILDWVPSHFPQDEHSLGFFDGAHEYEYADPRKGVQLDWNSFIFNYGRPEVRSFLLSSAMFWLEQYHADALRVDAVASMLYLDYSRRPGQWVPNQHGGRENLEAIGFLQQMNVQVFGIHSDTQTIAEESTAWPKVSRPVYAGGLGFGMKWDMGWMHDTLQYMSQDPLFRMYHHGELTFRMAYAFNENFVLPLSHDEVVYGKGSLIGKMPGDRWQKFANLRLLLSYMYTVPGKKLLFMGGEFGQWSEWNHDGQLNWELLEYPEHSAIRALVTELNHLYRSERALHERENNPATFEWLDSTDAENNVISFLRKGTSETETLAVICNFSGAVRPNYRIGVPQKGLWKEVFNSDDKRYGGGGIGNPDGSFTRPIALHGSYHSLTLTLPPLGAILLKLAK